MGLFSFIRDAGAKLFGGGDDKEEQAAADVAAKAADGKSGDANNMKDALRAEVDRLGLTPENFEVDLGTQVVAKGITDTNEQREKIILALGNVNGVGVVEDHITVKNPEPEAIFHEVKSGDSLSKIAKEVYGDPMKYPVIFEANKPMLSDPDKIYPGQILRCPPVE